MFEKIVKLKYICKIYKLLFKSELKPSKGNILTNKNQCNVNKVYKNLKNCLFI